VARDKTGEIIFNAMIRQTALEMPTGPLAPFRRSVLFQQILAYLQQAPKNRRVFEQFVRVFSSENAPQIGPDIIRDNLDDMVQAGFLEKQADVFMPASEGWGFIQSNRIYANIQAPPSEVSLIDVESGQVVARVAGVRDSSDGIRVAGRSFEILPGGTAGTQRVRSGGDHGEAPRYHARSLPYAYDVGACLANYFEIAANELVTIRVGQSIVVWTWLGKLINSVLGKCLRRRGCVVSEGSFHLSLDCDESSLMGLIRESVNEAEAKNPLGKLKLEQIVDLGPNFRYLSTTLQCKATEDWLDMVFLRTWLDRISQVRRLPAGSEISMRLHSLME
jgi:hypothetical protein